ncbi:DNA methyltransferase [Candidatus Hydrogenisulfobacillus filiaventi]|uniref:DNA methyltransferase n=1 Tax=Candidatus Hydrogenisulfobacillus filiaventi TaxID=2707344 RepID=A0A6F8ZIC9_9FIRM|nr:DNA methyltransferase [Candidatus Hydrogenisulfobacillus filiaventi]
MGFHGDGSPVLFPWRGGKVRLAHWIADRLPPHRAYVEPFAGTLAVLLAKRPSPVEIIHDGNLDLLAVYRCLQDEACARRLYRRLGWTPIHREEWARSRSPVPDGLDGADEELERAARFLVRLLQGFGGKEPSGTWAGGLSGDLVNRLITTRSRFWRVARRLRGVVIETAPWRDILRRYDRPDTIFYLDPPYLVTSGETTQYGLEFGEAEHRALLDAAMALRGMVVISGYDHPLYRRLDDAGWWRENRRVPVNLVGRTATTGLAGGRLREADYRTECLWWSPSAWNGRPRQQTLFAANGGDA